MTKSNSRITLDKSQPIYVGIDVHKRSWSTCLLHCGEVVGRFTLKGEFELLKKLLQKYEGMVIYSVYEAGFSGFYLHFELEKIGVKTIITPPNKIPTNTGDKVKTDRRDSFKLGNYLSKGLLKAIFVPSQEQLNLRQIIRTREQAKRKRVRAVNQIKNLLILNGIYLNSVGITKKDRDFLSCIELPATVKMSIQLHLQEYELINRQLDELRSEFLKVRNHDRYGKIYNLIKTTPGIGPLIAASLTYEIGDWTRFHNERQISAFFGLTPSEYSSGDSIHRGRITGQGNPALRALLIQASWKLIEGDPNMKEFFNRLTRQTGSKKKAIVAVARKLICRVYAMVKTGKEYEVRAAA